MANRYTQISPAKFTPFSMQEIFTPPSLMRQQHDASEAAALEMDALDINRLSQDDPEVSNKLNTLRGKIADVSSRLATSGFDRSIQNELLNIRREYAREMSPTGYLGHAQKNYMTAQEGWKAQQDAYVKSGASPDYINKMRNIYMSEGYPGVQTNGMYNDFTPGRTPGWHDIPAQMRQFFSSVNTSEIESSPEQYDFKRAPNGQWILWDKKAGTISNNAPQLMAALNAEMSELTDMGSDRGYSARLQGYTEDELSKIANYTKDAYFKQTLKPADTSFHPLSMPEPRTASTTNNFFDFPKRNVQFGQNVKGAGVEQRSMWFTRRESPYEIMVGLNNPDTQQPINKPLGDITIDSPALISSIGGEQLNNVYRSDKSMPIRNVSIKDARLLGYKEIFQIDYIEEIPTQNGKPKSIENLEKDRKLKKELDKIANSNPDNIYGGAYATIAGNPNAPEAPSLGKLPEGTAPRIGNDGKPYVIYKDGNAEVKVILKSQLVKIVEGVHGKYDGEMAKATDADKIRAYIPATRNESIRDLGIDAPISPPINVTFGGEVDQNGLIPMVVQKQQPIWSANSALSMFEDAAVLAGTYKQYILALQNNLMAGSPEMMELQKVLRAYDIDLNTTLMSFEYLEASPRKPLDALIGGITPRNEGDRKPGERYGVNWAVTPEEKQALENILHFMSAIEVMEVQKGSGKSKNE